MGCSFPHHEKTDNLGLLHACAAETEKKHFADSVRHKNVSQLSCCAFPSDALKLQFAESGVPEALSEMIRSLQGGDDPHDFCSMKIASNLIVSLLLGGECRFV